MPLENMLPAGADTLLVIEDIGANFLYQARGLQQTLSIISDAKRTARTVNGTLLDLSATQFRKFASKISCRDVNVPPFDGLWPGMQVTVHCAASLCYPTATGSASRPAVSGSAYTEGHMSFYRPVLEMIITDITPTTFDEWRAENQWDMALEEV